MGRVLGMMVVVAMLMAGSCAGLSQNAAAGFQTAAVGGGVSGGGVSGAGGHVGGLSAVAAPDARTEKQKVLAQQADRLFDMATELKAQVDKTNKNILSLKVVEKAEEIEALAKGMRGQVKK